MIYTRNMLKMISNVSMKYKISQKYVNKNFPHEDKVIFKLKLEIVLYISNFIKNNLLFLLL